MAGEIRANCPQCHSITQSGRTEPKYYYNLDKGTGFCHHCGYTGRLTDEEVDSLNIVSIKNDQEFDSASFDNLEPLNNIAISYLLKRFPGIELEKLTPFQLRYSKKYHAIGIPLFDAKQEIKGIKYRLIAPLNSRYISEQGSQFGGYWLSGKSSKLLVVEGELDAITARLCGFDGTILALQTNRLSSDSVAYVRSFKNIFLCLDNDQAGLEGIQLIRDILGSHEPSVIVLRNGVKDINELLEKDGYDESYRFLAKETRTEIEKSTVNLTDSIPEMLEYLSDRRNTRGISTGYPSLDKLLGGGLRPTEMTVINAFAKTGKTGFINNLVHNLAKAGQKVAMASFEMDPARTLFPSMLSIAGSFGLRSIEDSEQLKQAVELIQSECSYLNNIVTFKRFGYTPWSEVEEWATLMKERLNIEFLVLDHAGFMVEKMTDADLNQELAKNIKKLTNTLGIHILVVVQAPKTKEGLSIQTSYGGMAWGQNSDNFFILERVKDNELKLNVKLEAARYPGASPSFEPTPLTYNKETCSLSE